MAEAATPASPSPPSKGKALYERDNCAGRHVKLVPKLGAITFGMIWNDATPCTAVLSRASFPARKFVSFGLKRRRLVSGHVLPNMNKHMHFASSGIYGRIWSEWARLERLETPQVS